MKQVYVNNPFRKTILPVFQTTETGAALEIARWITRDNSILLAGASFYFTLPNPFC